MYKRAYKFRRLCPMWQILEILEQRRLHCADWKDLNDPSEGHYLVENGESPEKVREILAEKSKLRVCSLCKFFDNPLMWAHYADGFAGVAIEVEIPKSATDDVIYTEELPHVDTANYETTKASARRVLLSKLTVWEHEQEMRILQEQQSFSLDMPVCRVLFGCRIDVSRAGPLILACNKLQITMTHTRIAKGKILLAENYAYIGPTPRE